VATGDDIGRLDFLVGGRKLLDPQGGVFVVGEGGARLFRGVARELIGVGDGGGQMDDGDVQAVDVDNLGADGADLGVDSDSLEGDGSALGVGGTGLESDDDDGLAGDGNVPGEDDNAAHLSQEELHDKPAGALPAAENTSPVSEAYTVPAAYTVPEDDHYSPPAQAQQKTPDQASSQKMNSVYTSPEAPVSRAATACSTDQSSTPPHPEDGTAMASSPGVLRTDRAAETAWRGAGQYTVRGSLVGVEGRSSILGDPVGDLRGGYLVRRPVQVDVLDLGSSCTAVPLYGEVAAHMSVERRAAQAYPESRLPVGARNSAGEVLSIAAGGEVPAGKVAGTPLRQVAWDS
jgi:hypothetical protein